MMIQEYLFTDISKYDEVESYKEDGVTIEIERISETDCFIATYSVNGENEDSAKLLSKVDGYILKKYSPTVLTNESSAYFNKRLYPNINEFERKLRKLLYLKSAVNDHNHSFDNIKNLEDKDLGSIFDLLFTDENFIKQTKSKINDKTWNFSKKEIFDVIDALKEETLWDDLMEDDSVSTLRNNYSLVKAYRNDVMHAHNIDYKKYSDSKKLFENVNLQLDIEIGKISSNSKEDNKRENENDFNETLSVAIKLFKELPKDDLFPELSKTVNLYKELKLLFKTMNDVKKVIQSPEIKAIKDQKEMVEAIKKSIEKEKNDSTTE